MAWVAKGWGPRGRRAGGLGERGLEVVQVAGTLGISGRGGGSRGATLVALVALAEVEVGEALQADVPAVEVAESLWVRWR